VTLGVLMAVWQMCHYAALTVQILFATRTLGLSEHAVGLCYMGMGVGTITGSVLGRRVSHRIGPGPCLVVGYAICGFRLAAGGGGACQRLGRGGLRADADAASPCGAVFIFINFLALRQAVTPEPLLGRMTSTMRWLTCWPPRPARCWAAGWVNTWACAAALGFAGGVSALLVVVAWRLPRIRTLRALPAPDPRDEAEAAAGAARG
jgi:hypothetical protein